MVKLKLKIVEKSYHCTANVDEPWNLEDGGVYVIISMNGMQSRMRDIVFDISADFIYYIQLANIIVKH